MTESIPSVDLNSRYDEISEAIASVGFLSVRRPALPSTSQIDQMFELSKEFFLGESDEEKHKVGITVGNVGWVKVRQEKLDADGHPSGDIKEAFNMRLFDEHDNARQPLPPKIAAHRDEVALFMRSCHELCMRLLGSLALALELPEDFFRIRHSYDRPQGTILRLLYYPATALRESPSQAGNIRAGAHSDYGSLTLLFQRDIGGLQILLPGNPPRWLNAPVVNDNVLVNIGDLMEFWTGGKYRSTTHRVSLPHSDEEAQDRFSIAYFLHPDDEVLLTSLTDGGEHVGDTKGCITAREYLEQRLSSTYASRKGDHV